MVLYRWAIIERDEFTVGAAADGRNSATTDRIPGYSAVDDGCLLVELFAVILIPPASMWRVAVSRIFAAAYIGLHLSLIGNNTQSPLLRFVR